MSSTADAYAKKNAALLREAGMRQERLNTLAMLRTHYAKSLIDFNGHRGQGFSHKTLLEEAHQLALADLHFRDRDTAEAVEQAKADARPPAQNLHG